MPTALADDVLRRLFLDARSIQAFTSEPVPDNVVERLYALASLAPTGFNSQPARYVFVRSQPAKDLLAPALSSSNRAKMLGAPLTAIIAYDRRFFDRVHELFPSYDARSLFEKAPQLAVETAERNAALQAAFFLLAARSLGLDAGPMSGFKADEIDSRFFPDGRCHTLLVVNLGYGDRGKLGPRLPRLSFADAARIA
ncbi:MAG TPA: malonic semialdehyde reductase [Polyangia bacterium]